MASLTWNRWHRTKGCREWMDKTPFAGVPFTEIFYDGMRMLFADEKNRPGLLYQGLVWPEHVAFRSALDAARNNIPQFGNSSLPLLKIKAADAPT